MGGFSHNSAGFRTIRRLTWVLIITMLLESRGLGFYVGSILLDDSQLTSPATPGGPFAFCVASPFNHPNPLQLHGRLFGVQVLGIPLNPKAYNPTTLNLTTLHPKAASPHQVPRRWPQRRAAVSKPAGLALQASACYGLGFRVQGSVFRV